MMTAFMKVLKKSFSKPALTFAPTLAILNNIHAIQAKPFTQPHPTYIKCIGSHLMGSLWARLKVITLTEI